MLTPISPKTNFYRDETGDKILGEILYGVKTFDRFLYGVKLGLRFGVKYDMGWNWGYDLG